MAIIPFKCPSCGGDAFRGLRDQQPQSYKDLVGFSCPSCSYEITDKDIERWAVRVAEKRLKDALKNRPR
jgi:hypothetical protein